MERQGLEESDVKDHVTKKRQDEEQTERKVAIILDNDRHNAKYNSNESRFSTNDNPPGCLLLCINYKKILTSSSHRCKTVAQNTTKNGTISSSNNCERSQPPCSTALVCSVMIGERINVHFFFRKFNIFPTSSLPEKT